MSITTRFGDQGDTRLFSGEVVAKDSARPSAYGDLDELVSLLGVARNFCVHKATAEAILQLQRELFIVGSEIATMPAHYGRLPRRVDQALMAELDRRRDALEARTTLPTGFVVPANGQSASFLDLARAVSRRVERRAVSLHAAGDLPNVLILNWLNRLSDYLYLLARSEEASFIPVKPA